MLNKIYLLNLRKVCIQDLVEVDGNGETNKCLVNIAFTYKRKKKKGRMRSLLNGTFGVAIGLKLRIKPMTYAPVSCYTLFFFG